MSRWSTCSHRICEPRWLRSIVADACNLPPDLGEFDLVLSNSVIEHVGGHWRARNDSLKASEIAPRYWVQTPYRYFPIEPHFVFPFLQHLPRVLQARIAVAWPLGNYAAMRDPNVAMEHVQNIELLGRSEMRWYFPDAEIVTEHALGLPKALIAVKRQAYAELKRVRAAPLGRPHYQTGSVGGRVTCTRRRRRPLRAQP